MTCDYQLNFLNFKREFSYLFNYYRNFSKADLEPPATSKMIIVDRSTWLMSQRAPSWMSHGSQKDFIYQQKCRLSKKRNC